VLGVALVAGAVAQAAPGASHVVNLNQLEREERAAGFGREREIKVVPIDYRAHDGLLRRAYVLLPRWYGPGRDPPIPLVISPHGRGVPATANVKLWGNLPALGDFAVVCPEGQGRRLRLFAWGDPGDIADLARMPHIVSRALPYLRIARNRVYAIGSSMGGQETLLLVARYPHLLAGAAAFDADTNLAARYSLIGKLKLGRSLQHKLVLEVGGTPATAPAAYRVRSPLYWARQIAASGVPLQIWWSVKDKIVRDQAEQSGLLYRRLRALHPRARLTEVVGTWSHSAEFRATRRLALALSAFGLFPTEAHTQMTSAQKRALELPSSWPGRPLAPISVRRTRR
jgi:pimeloyl-ACP methyl ester carboxylesterase